jgi:hypothetical protein
LSRRAWSQADGGRVNRSFTWEAVKERYSMYPGPWVERAFKKNVVWNEATLATLKKYVKAEQYKAGTDVVSNWMWNSIASEMSNLEYPVYGEMRKLVFTGACCQKCYRGTSKLNIL